ncbi:hypothetical protein VNO78_34995 [Psophocarpus tetragonolobus]|uniref:Uncharacterized protein n=1 Tax=Psophocarpus tetragonolobus TaxID=3891 RepID=A0AAN9NNB1_PSOTE
MGGMVMAGVPDELETAFIVLSCLRCLFLAVLETPALTKPPELSYWLLYVFQSREAFLQLLICFGVVVDALFGGHSVVSPQGVTTTSGVVVVARGVFLIRAFVLVVPPWSLPCMSGGSALLGVS